MEQHFRPTVADPGYDVVTENRYFSGPDGVEWEELSFSVNGSHWGANRPPFPLLQAEKVLSLPLQLQFGLDYRYRLDGLERVDGFDCYVVKFDPVEEKQSLYRGTVWIDRRTFARVKVQAVQTNLSAPVVSNEEVQRYRPVASIDGHPLFLFEGLTARQIVIAGRNLLVEKPVTFSDFVVNRALRRSRGARGRRSHWCQGGPGPAVLRQAGHGPRGQRPRDAEGQGHGDGGYDRSVVRFSASHLRNQLPELRARRPAGFAARDAVCRRARGDQHSTPEDRPHAVRRERRPVRHRRAVERSGSRCAGEPRRATTWLATTASSSFLSPEPGMAVHAIPESDLPPVPGSDIITPIQTVCRGVRALQQSIINNWSTARAAFDLWRL